MPFKIRKLNNKNLYKITNEHTGNIISHGSSLENTKKIINLLNNIDNLKGGKMKIRDVQNLLKSSYKNNMENVDNFKIDKDLSKKNTKVYTDEKNKAYVVHRGTSNLQDVITDVKMLFGNIKNQKRFKDAKKIQKNVENKYGAENVTTLGHSLGAKIGEVVGKDSNEIITYNKPTLFQDFIKHLKIKINNLI